MKRNYIGILIIAIGLVAHFTLFKWGIGSTHYSMYMENVRDLNPEDKNELLFLQLGKSEYSKEPRFQGYRRGFGIFFRDFLSTDTLRFLAILLGIIGTTVSIGTGAYFIAFRSKNA